MSEAQRTRRKRLGAWYTPPELVRAIVSEAVFPEARSVLDPACGDGRFLTASGLDDVVGVDIDPQALIATADNAEQNFVGHQVVLHADAARIPPAADVVLANILATPLKVLAPLLCARVAPGGHLVLAGILSRQADELRQAYAAHAELQVIDEEDGWVCMGAHMPT